MPNHQRAPLSRLLVVDDDPSIRFSLMAVLDKIGFSARSADNGLSALVEIERQIPNIVLSDLNMPRMSGVELLNVVRRHFPSIHLIAMSGAFYGDELPSGVAADAFYQKGSGLGCLLKIIERFTQPRPLPVHPRTASALLWILRNGNDASGEPCVSINCPDCHRTFEQQVGGSLSLIRETHCPRCGNPIYYAIVEPVDLAPTLPFQRVVRKRGSDRAELHF